MVNRISVAAPFHESSSKDGLRTWRTSQRERRLSAASTARTWLLVVATLMPRAWATSRSLSPAASRWATCRSRAQSRPHPAGCDRELAADPEVAKTPRAALALTMPVIARSNSARIARVAAGEAGAVGRPSASVSLVGRRWVMPPSPGSGIPRSWMSAGSLTKSSTPGSSPVTCSPTRFTLRIKSPAATLVSSWRRCGRIHAPCLRSLARIQPTRSSVFPPRRTWGQNCGAAPRCHQGKPATPRREVRRQPSRRNIRTRSAPDGFSMLNSWGWAPASPDVGCRCPSWEFWDVISHVAETPSTQPPRRRAARASPSLSTPGT